jgi:hypothetical protein
VVGQGAKELCEAERNSRGRGLSVGDLHVKGRGTKNSRGGPWGMHGIDSGPSCGECGWKGC